MSEDDKGEARDILIANIRLRACEVATVPADAFRTVMFRRLEELDHLLEDLADVVMGRVERPRAARLAELIEEHRDTLEDPSCLDGCSDADRYLLVEESSRSANVWLSTYVTPEAAARYRDGEEYPEDWSDAKLIDLDTGDELVPTTTFVRESVT